MQGPACAWVSYLGRKHKVARAHGNSENHSAIRARVVPDAPSIELRSFHNSRQERTIIIRRGRMGEPSFHMGENNLRSECSLIFLFCQPIFQIFFIFWYVAINNFESFYI